MHHLVVPNVYRYAARDMNKGFEREASTLCGIVYTRGNSEVPRDAYR